MATTTNITTTFAGEFKNKYISAALLSAPTIDKGLITVMDNIKFKEVVQKFADGNVFSDATCDFTDVGEINLTERVLEPKELQLNRIICKKDFRSTWESIEMGSSIYDNLPPTFADYLVAHYAAKAAEANEKNIWVGDATNTGEFDGFSTLLAADADLPAANEIAGTTVGKDNVIDELYKVFAAIPDTLYGKEDLRIYVSPNIYRAYQVALGGFAANGLGANGVNGLGPNQDLQPLFYAGVQIVMVNGLAANTAIAAQISNLFFGTCLVSDMTEVKVIDTSETLGDQNVRVIMRMTGGVQYGIVEEIITYGIPNAAN
jgi:hypothetical protein